MAVERYRSLRKGLLDKLGVTPASSVAVLGVSDAEFLRQLSERTGIMPSDRLSRNLDLIFYGADSLEELGRLATLRKFLKPTGAIWVVALKGKAARIKDADSMRAGKAAGLVDNKVCGFSETQTALRLVIPVNAREASPA